MDADLRERLEKIFPKKFLATMIFNEPNLPWASQIAIGEEDEESVIYDLDEMTLRALEEYYRLLITFSPQAIEMKKALIDVVDEPPLEMIQERALEHLPFLRTIQ